MNYKYSILTHPYSIQNQHKILAENCVLDMIYFLPVNFGSLRVLKNADSDGSDVDCVTFSRPETNAAYISNGWFP
jgi:hypothetical protein